MSWVWEHSRSKSSQRLVLLAIADCAADNGGNAYPSMAALVSKTGLSTRTVQDCLRKLVELAELSIAPNAGPRGCNRYRIRMTPADSAPPQILHPPAKSAPAKSAPPQNPRRPPAKSAPGTVIEPSEISPAATQQAALSITQRSKRITDAYHDAEPLSKWPAVNAIVIKAIKSERFTDDEIRNALLRLATEGRGVTIETLRVELQGLPSPGSAVATRNGHSPKPSTTDQRVAAGLALAEELKRRGQT